MAVGFSGNFSAFSAKHFLSVCKLFIVMYKRFCVNGGLFDWSFSCSLLEEKGVTLSLLKSIRIEIKGKLKIVGICMNWTADQCSAA